MKSTDRLTVPKTKLGKSNILRVIYIGLIFVFCLLPLILLLFNIRGEDLRYVFSNDSFYKAIKNSLYYTLISALISMILALFTAYFLSRSNIKKGPFILLLTIPMLIPTLSVGLGIRMLFGTNGLLDTLFGIEKDVIGNTGLILGSIIVSFPPTFLILYDALKYENKFPYDAAEIMGVKKFSTFFNVTLPYLFKPLVTAFFACFTLIFSDYGMPMELGGKVKTLPMYLYEQISSLYKYGRGALVGLFLLIPALLSFFVDMFLKENYSDDANESLIKPSKLFNTLTVIICSIVILFISIPEISFISLSFIKGYPSNMEFTFDNLKNIFTNTHGVGLIAYIKNSILIAFLTGAIGTFFAYTAGYLSTRVKSKSGKVLHFLSVSSIAIPGIVLGVGYIFLFKETKGFFYGTITILVAVNVIHFLGSPYLMAKNCFEKMNSNYETVGKTIGVSNFRIFLNVLVPNSLNTLVEMFSYFFLNSMITISAVAFLSTYASQPLSLLITTYEKTSNYEMQAVVSLTILLLNLFFKGVFALLQNIALKKTNKKEINVSMELTRYQFDLLVFLESRGKQRYSQRSLSDDLTLSLGTVNKLIKDLLAANCIAYDMNDELYITEKGIKVLEPYKVKRAIIIAAGFGSRLAPITFDTPKPLILINGVRIIDTLIDALLGKGIENITIVRGYQKEKFDVLLEKYPFIQFVDNEEFNNTNNISSLVKVAGRIDRCYICDADLYVKNPDVISKYEFTTCYAAAKVNETDDWCFKKVNGYAANYQMGGVDCYQAYGISFWNEKDSVLLREDLIKAYNSRAGKENFWDVVPLKIYKKNYRVEIKKCHKSDMAEIDNLSELLALDPGYKDYPGINKFLSD